MLICRVLLFSDLELKNVCSPGNVRQRISFQKRGGSGSYSRRGSGQAVGDNLLRWDNAGGILNNRRSLSNYWCSLSNWCWVDAVHNLLDSYTAVCNRLDTCCDCGVDVTCNWSVNNIASCSSSRLEGGLCHWVWNNSWNSRNSGIYRSANISTLNLGSDTCRNGSQVID